MTGAQHFTAAEESLDAALQAKAGNNEIDARWHLSVANLHAALAQAAADLRIAEDEDREAAAEERLAACVPQGGSNFGVSLAGAR